MKLFVIFGIICFVNPEAPRGISCIEYMEPKSKTYSKKDCYNYSQKIGDTIVEQFSKEGIQIFEQIIWCVNAKGEPV